jgi:hypothetical protein
METIRCLSRIRTTGFIVLITLALATNSFAYEQDSYGGLHRQKNDPWLEVGFVAEHSEKLQHLLWIVPLLLFGVGCSYMKRMCPGCGKGWGLRYTGNTLIEALT